MYQASYKLMKNLAISSIRSINLPLILKLMFHFPFFHKVCLEFINIIVRRKS
jgi:hypothetical protein